MPLLHLPALHSSLHYTALHSTISPFALQLIFFTLLLCTLPYYLAPCNSHSPLYCFVLYHITSCHATPTLHYAALHSTLLLHALQLPLYTILPYTQNITSCPATPTILYTALHSTMYLMPCNSNSTLYCPTLTILPHAQQLPLYSTLPYTLQCT